MPHMWKSISLTLAAMLGKSLSHLTPAEIEGLARVHYRRNKNDFLPTETFVRGVHELLVSTPNEFMINGEAWLIERAGKFGFTTIFDVGANIGDWTNFAALHHRQATIHCFEIVPATFEKLRRNVAGLGGRVVPNSFGLSDCDAEIEVFTAPSNAYIASMYEFQGDEREKIFCCVRRGDDYATERKIGAIDFLKIDVEGAESKVIGGLEYLLTAKNIRLVQFEYNRGAIESHFLLKDFYDFFAARGYVLGKLTPDGVSFRDYEYAHEDFNGPNYVACLAEDHDLIRAISVSGGMRNR